AIIPGSPGAGLVVAVSILAGAVAGWFERLRLVATVSGAVLALGFVVIDTPLVTASARSWVRSDAMTAAPYDAIVPLSGGLNPDSTLGPAAVERLIQALHYVQRGLAPQLVTTREFGTFDGRPLSADHAQRQLVSLAHAEAVWRITGAVSNTHDEAVEVARLLLPEGRRRVVVVTSALHTRRACAAFEHVGFTVICAPAGGAASGFVTSSSADQRLMVFRDLLHELLGMLRYRLSGWV
ncbi:MAG: YdcF family protein, partial [Deltaproteobacteria bacterium]